jgi:hypothetical protein
VFEVEGLKSNRNSQVIEKVFFDNYREGANEVHFTREEMEQAPGLLGIKPLDNIGDTIYTFRYRAQLPESITKLATYGKTWVLLPDGDGKYVFRLWSNAIIEPTKSRLQIKIPDSTPGMIRRYAMSDEQALLAILRYNRLLDIFLGITCFHLQSHLRTKLVGVGQIEVDDLFVGVDTRGAHYMITVQAKGGTDKLGTVQFWQDNQFVEQRYKDVVGKHVGAAFLHDQDAVALFDIVPSKGEMVVANETHYKLVSPSELTSDELNQYMNFSRKVN